MRQNFFSGVSSALVTPFLRGEVDTNSLKNLVRWQLDQGIQGFVVCGSTGEAATLTEAEKTKVLKTVITEVDGQVPVLMGIGSNNTKETAHLAKKFSKTKASGFLVVVPYYNKPPQRGLEAHFLEVAKASSKPLVLYNVPSRTIISLNVKPTLQNLMKNKKIVGIKEASGNLEVTKEILSLAPKNFTLLSGDDETFAEAMDLGAHGVISVVSQVIPEACLKRAMGDRAVIQSVSKAMFCESNPIPVKWALAKMGIIRSAELRLPLMTLDSSLQKTVEAELKKAGVL